MNTGNQARIARRRAQRIGLRLSQCGSVFRLYDENETTLAVGALGVVNAYMAARMQPKPPGPPPSTFAPESWRRHIDDYLLTLAAGGQRESTIRLRKATLCVAARGLECPPSEVTGEKLVNWLGRQQHLSQETRKGYRSALRGFFAWMYEMDRVPTYIGDALPKVRVPKAPPRPANDDAWQTALAKADRRTELMLRLAGEAGLRRAEVAQVHSRDLVDAGCLRVHGKGGKDRVVPIRDYLTLLIRENGEGFLFSNGVGGHLTAGHVGRLIARAIPGDATAHCLRHRFATRAYAGSHDIRATQLLLGHASVATTERYTAISDDSLRAAAAHAW